MKCAAYLAAMLAVSLAAAGCSKKKEGAPGAAAGSGSAPAAAAGSGSAGGSGSAAAAAGSGSAAAAGSGSAAAATPPAPYTPAADVPEAIKAAIAAADRSDADRALDAGRKPGEVLAFFRVAPGQKIGELFAGVGYTTRAARADRRRRREDLRAEQQGHPRSVRAQAVERAPREAGHEERRRVRAARSTTPFPADVHGLDAVITILNYHDAVWQGADRPKMNKAVFDALKPGGVYAIVDHSAAAGSGTRDAQTLHRIDEEVVKKEVTAAGFKLDAESDVLRNPADTRDWNSSPSKAGERRGTSDRFMLRFVKPAS